MHFGALENFEWMNEPENVRFEDNSMIVYAKSGTDFWQSVHRGFHKDDGHFFFSRQEGDFIITLKWSFEKLNKFSQCGLMLRVDERNWLKVSLMNESFETDTLVSAVTTNGHSDLVEFSLPHKVNDIWFRLQRTDDDYMLFYSLDGVAFKRLRIFYLQSYEEVKVGAYIANPGDKEFDAELSNIMFGA